MKEYALYKGEEILAMGTPYQIADELGISIDTVTYYGTEAYKRKLTKRIKSKNFRLLVEIKD